MQAHFDAIGPSGRRMMRQTAALQVCVDTGRGRIAWERWRLANLAGPALSAAFANSPIIQGEMTGCKSARSRIWQNVDPSRTGFAGLHIGADSEAAYIEFALN